MTRMESDTIAAARALECPIQLDQLRGFISLIEVLIQRVHVHPDLLVEGHANRIDPDK